MVYDVLGFVRREAGAAERRPGLKRRALGRNAGGNQRSGCELRESHRDDCDDEKGCDGIHRTSFPDHERPLPRLSVLEHLTERNRADLALVVDSHGDVIMGCLDRHLTSHSAPEVDRPGMRRMARLPSG